MNQQYQHLLIERNWLTPEEVAAWILISTSTLAKWRMKNKNFEFAKFGKFVRYNRAQIEAFMNANIVKVEK